MKRSLSNVHSKFSRIQVYNSKPSAPDDGVRLMLKDSYQAHRVDYEIFKTRIQNIWLRVIRAY